MLTYRKNLRRLPWPSTPESASQGTNEYEWDLAPSLFICFRWSGAHNDGLSNYGTTTLTVDVSLYEAPEGGKGGWL